LAQELRATLFFINFANCTCRQTKRIQASQESAIRLLAPPHVAGPVPPGTAKRVKTAVVPDSRIGIRLDWVTTTFTKATPRVDHRRVGLSDTCNRVTAAFRRFA
jgi:hypothetical protein